MLAEKRLYFPIFLFIYLLFCSSRFAISQPLWDYNISLSNSTAGLAGLSSFWINRPTLYVNSTSVGFFGLTTPILQRGNAGPRFLCGFHCNYNATECLLGIILFHNRSDGDNVMINKPHLVWSANRNHPVKVNATLQLGQDGNLVLKDSDGTLVWSTDTIGKSVSGLNLTEMGNLVLFDKRKSVIWQSFDHPTDSLLPGQSVVSGQKLIASVSATNQSQGLFSLTVLNGSWAAYTDTDPPQYYDTSYYADSPYYSFDGRTFTALQYPNKSTAQFMKIEPDGHFKVYQWFAIDWNEVSDILAPYTKNCGYPMVCGRYSICTNNGQCTCPPQENFFRPFSERKPDLGCSQLTSIYCNSSQYHSFVELKNTTYFSFNINQELNLRVFWLEREKVEDCKRACLSNCSCKAAVFEYDWNGGRRGNCLLLNEVFSLIDSEEGRSGTTVFLKVQNTSKALTRSPIIPGGTKSRTSKVIIGSTLAALFGIILSITTCFVIFKKRTHKSRKAADLLDLEPILPGILTRFSYNELKVITEDFSRKLGEGGFGSVYEGTLRNGTKIAVKHLDGLGQVKESFLTEVKTVGGIHHINLAKLIGFCAEKSHRLLIYEYMVNGSLDKWITHENQENGLTWNTRQRIISDVAKGLAYLHEDCSHKIIHLDIKPQNILLDQHFNAKISDFGLSKLIEKDKSKVVTRMRGTRGYLAPEWLSSVITEKVDVYAFGIVLLEILCGRKNLDWSQADEEDVHLLSVFRRKAEQEQLMDMVDKNEDMQLHREAVTEMMSLAAWCLQGDFSKRPSMSLVVKALEGLVTVETNLDYDFTHVPVVGAGNQQREVIISSKFPSILSGPRFAFSQHWWKLNVSLLNSTSGISTSWINRPFFIPNSTAGFYALTPILLRGTTGPRYHICGFYCNYSATECVLGILLVIFQHSSTGEIDYIYELQLVWSANRNHPVNINATLQLGQDGNLVLTDSDGTLVWSTNTTGKSVSGLNLTETGNLVLFDKLNHAIWQSFDHPTDCLLPGQNLVSGQKLIASVSASNWSQGLFSLTILNGSWTTYIDSDPPQFYYSSPYTDSRYFSFDGRIFTALKHPPRPAAQFIKLGADGHLRVYQEGNFFQWTEIFDILTPDFGNCGYPMVCGRYSICSNDGQCSCPVEGNFFRPFNDRRPHLGCTALTSISCDSSQYHSLVELKNTTYFAVDYNVYQLSLSLWSETKKLEDCKRACLSNCSCKAIVWDWTQIKNCLFLNEVFSLIDKEERVYNNMTIFLKVHNSSKAQMNHSPNISPGLKSKPFKVITGYTLAAFFGIILSITTCFILVKRRRHESSKAGDFLDLEPLLPGILTRFSYSDLKIITEDFSRKLGEGGFGSVYEGPLSDGTKIAVKHLDGLGQMMDSFLTEVKILGSIHHVNLVKLIGFCAEKSDNFLIYEYMVNGSLDRWISPENEDNGLNWHTRKRIISDIAKGLAYLHEDCSHKIIHLDIKPQNVLLDQYFNAKISDFGLSKLIEKEISKVMTRMRGTPGYLAPEWLSSVITEKVDVYAFGIVLLEILCGRKNLDWSQADEEDVQLLSVFRRKVEQEELMDMVDKNEDMQLHREEVTELMSIAAWCLQGDFTKRPSMSLVVKVLEGLVTVETNLDYNFRYVPKVGAGNKQREATISSKFPSILSGPR